MSTETLTPPIAPVMPELWISFVSLMRSHLGALQTTGKMLDVKLVENSPISFTMGDLDGNVFVSISLASGAGTYEVRSCGGPSDRGSWQLFPDGTTRLNSDAPEDLELSVEAFARKLLLATRLAEGRRA